MKKCGYLHTDRILQAGDCVTTSVPFLEHVSINFQVGFCGSIKFICYRMRHDNTTVRSVKFLTITSRYLFHQFYSFKIRCGSAE